MSADPLADLAVAAVFGALAIPITYWPRYGPAVPPPDINDDRLCTNCGYNLRGLAYENRCPECGSAQLDWEPASGRATVHTFSIARRPTHPAFTGDDTL